jgi:hypothetical protein
MYPAILILFALALSVPAFARPTYGSRRSPPRLRSVSTFTPSEIKVPLTRLHNLHPSDSDSSQVLKRHIKRSEIRHARMRRSDPQLEKRWRGGLAVAGMQKSLPPIGPDTTRNAAAVGGGKVNGTTESVGGGEGLSQIDLQAALTGSVKAPEAPTASNSLGMSIEANDVGSSPPFLSSASGGRH